MCPRKPIQAPIRTLRRNTPRSPLLTTATAWQCCRFRRNRARRHGARRTAVSLQHRVRGQAPPFGTLLWRRNAPDSTSPASMALHGSGANAVPAAAVAGGTVCDLASMAGTSDVGRGLAVFELGGTPQQNRDQIAAQSPIERVGEVTTPTLLLHGGAGPQSVTGFADQLAEAGPARVITPVHPGFAGTARPAGLDSVAGLARLYAALLDELGVHASPRTLPTGEEIVAAKQMVARLDDAWARVSEPQRAALRLVRGEGLSVAEAAVRLGTTVTGVKLRTHRASRALQAGIAADFLAA